MALKKWVCSFCNQAIICNQDSLIVLDWRLDKGEIVCRQCHEERSKRISSLKEDATHSRLSLDRRSSEDRRKAYDLDYSLSGGIERRGGKEKRHQAEKRMGWERVSNWSSIYIKPLTAKFHLDD